MSIARLMQMAAAGSAGGDYQISRSLRFNSADSAYLSRTPASAGNRKTWTWSGWVKKAAFIENELLFSARQAASPYFVFGFSGGAFYMVGDTASATSFTTTQLFRDPSAWYHIVVAIDTTQATSTDRVKIYVNGVQVTSFTSSSYPGLNNDTNVNATVKHGIGYQDTYGWYFSGYLADIHFVDGQQLTASSFGEVDDVTGVWKPIAYAGTYGTNGFHLDFSDNSSTTALGYDAAGSNDWTPNNFSVTAGAGNDSLVDSPTQYGDDTGAGGEVRGNYATLNPTAVSGMGLATLANGNLDASGTSSSYVGAVSTIAMSSGKWYWETTILALGQTNGAGIVASTSLSSAVGGSYGYATVSDCWWRASNGVVYSNSAGAVTGLPTFTTNDVINIAVDFDAGKLWFGKNGTWDSSGNPATGTNATITFTPGGKSFYAMVQAYTNSGPWNDTCNFGQRAFSSTAPSGFKALVTTNLPEPTVLQGDDHFNTVLYTGTGSSLGVTGVGFQPDFTWIKERSGAADHGLYDAVRGVTKQLESNTTTDETTEATGLTAFGADGFTVGALAQLNTSADTYVAWNWKANGAGGTGHTQGTISSTASVNTTAGISIVTYTGNATQGATVGHGLGVTPSMLIVKSRSLATNFYVWHKSLTQPDYQLYLNLTNAQDTAVLTFLNDKAPTSTLFELPPSGYGSNNSGATYVAYCFAEIESFSKFGSYTGNGSADGTFIYTGFRPAFIMIKQTSSSGNPWVIQDSGRSLFNLTGLSLYPNSNAAEESATGGASGFDFLSNGFKNRSSGSVQNASGGTYIYMAFATNPFKNALAR